MGRPSERRRDCARRAAILWTYLNASSDCFCTGDGTGIGEKCTVFPTTEYLNQIDPTIGLIVTLQKRNSHAIQLAKS